MILKDYLPERSAEDIWAERLRLVLGDQELVLAVLPMRDSDEWKVEVSNEIGHLMLGLEALDDLESVMRHFGTIERGTLIRLLRAYDRDQVLPDDEWLLTHVSEGQVLRSFLMVWSVANPTLAVIVDTMMRAPNLAATIAKNAAPAGSGNGSRQPTDGALATPEPT